VSFAITSLFRIWVIHNQNLIMHNQWEWVIYNQMKRVPKNSPPFLFLAIFCFKYSDFLSDYLSSTFQLLIREKLENIHASIPFNSVCQKNSGLISGVTPELWQSKPFGARKDLCTPFPYHLSHHTQLLKTSQIIQNVRPCLR
jgi:hypothetical protein